MADLPHPDTAVVAAGAVLWRPTTSTTAAVGASEVAVVHRPRYDDWSLPKGKLHQRETTAAAAVREIGEETGYTARLGARLGQTEYTVAEGDKIVYYWAAEAVSGAFAANDEVDELRWLGLDEAAGQLTYQHDVELVNRFREMVPLPRPVLLVRHAKAGSREDWQDDDDLRPLTGKGQRQAGELADLLSLFDPVRAYAAPPLRCPQTVQPLADRLELRIQPEPLLGEHGYWREPDAGLARLLELARQPGVPVICSQGGVIPDLVEQLTGRTDPPSRKASVWVLGFTDDKVVSADYYDEPGPVEPS